MTWTITNLIIHIVAGILGGHAAAGMLRDHRFGFIGHTVAGAAGGVLSGAFLQTWLIGVQNDAFLAPTQAEQWIVQGIAGAAAGAILMSLVAFVKKETAQHKAGEKH